MELRPLGDRILIRPDAPPPVSDIIHMPDIADRNVEMSGEVIALGDGPQRDARLKREILVDVREMLQECFETFRQQDSALKAMVDDELGRYAAIRPTEYEVKVGDRVVFPWSAGVKVQWDGEDLILLTEADPVAILEEESAA